VSQAPGAAPRREAPRPSVSSADGPQADGGVDAGALLNQLCTGILVLWCVLGLWFSGHRLLSPAVGWRLASSEATSGSIGLPLAESGSVSAIHELIRLAGSPEGPWLVVYPPDVDEVSVAYVRSQLILTEYPRHVEVVTTAGRPRLREYAGTITHPRVGYGGSDGRTLEHRGFTAHLRTAP
jgi:hypothetical protein